MTTRDLRYEFKTQTYFTTFTETGNETAEEAFVKGANQLGLDGWCIISILPAASRVGFTVFFERRIDDDEQCSGCNICAPEGSGWTSDD